MREDVPLSVHHHPGATLGVGRTFRWRLTGLYLVLTASAVAILVTGAVVLGYWRRAREYNACRANLTQIGLALQAYHKAYQRFPPAHVRGPDGRLWHSWRVLILPYLGEKELYREYRFDEPWDGPHNRELIPRIPACLACPGAEAHRGCTNYFAVVSPRTMWPAHLSLSLRDVTDGSSNTVHVVEDRLQDVAWLEPRDVTALELWADIRSQASPHLPEESEYSRLMLFVDGTVQSIRPGGDRSLLSSLLTPATGHAWIAPEDWPPDLAGDPPPLDFGPQRSAAELPATDISAVRDADLDADQTVLWCATFQMVWDAFRDKLQVDPVPFLKRPPLAAALDRWRYPQGSLAPDCYTLMLEGVDAASAERIRAAVRDQFSGAESQAASISETLPGFRLYTYLEKRMPFAQAFDPLPVGITFHGAAGDADVAAFGAVADDDDGLGAPLFEDQMHILDYVSDDDFIIELSTNGSANDRIILAKTEPAQTLQQTWEAVQQRIATPDRWHDRPNLMSVEPLSVPVLVFNLRRDFEELRGAVLDLPGSEWDRFWIESAWQGLKLRLDAHGADFVSEAELGIVGDFGDEPDEPPPPPPEPRKFLFDRPFLMVLREQEAPEPYFIGWIGNAELMEVNSTALPTD